MINILSDMYSKANMAVKSSEGSSEECPITIGLLQGEILSPLLFTLFIADLVKILIKKGIREAALDKITEVLASAFADNKVFLAENIVIKKKKIKALEEYFQLNSLVVNIDKTKVVLFQKKGF